MIGLGFREKSFNSFYAEAGKYCTVYSKRILKHSFVFVLQLAQDQRILWFDKRFHVIFINNEKKKYWKYFEKFWNTLPFTYRYLKVFSWNMEDIPIALYLVLNYCSHREKSIFDVKYHRFLHHWQTHTKQAKKLNKFVSLNGIWFYLFYFPINTSWLNDGDFIYFFK